MKKKLARFFLICLCLTGCAKGVEFMKNFYVLCGIAGSGKSTWINNHLAAFKGYTKVVSRDDIRFMIVNEDEEYFSREKQVFKKFIEELKDGLENYDNVIADATHLNLASRTKLLRNLTSSLKDANVYAIVIDTPVKTCLKQNATRRGRRFVPEDQIIAMGKRLTIPTFEEGFDKIFIYNPKDKTYKILEKSDENR